MNQLDTAAALASLIAFAALAAALGLTHRSTDDPNGRWTARAFWFVAFPIGILAIVIEMVWRTTDGIAFIVSAGVSLGLIIAAATSELVAAFASGLAPTLPTTRRAEEP